MLGAKLVFLSKVAGLMSLVFLLGSFHDVYHSSHSCFPSGDKKEIPIFDGSRGEEQTGLTEEEFNLVLDELKEVYTPVFEEIEKNFVVNYLWTNNQVNATAQQRGNNWIINMYGGLARHEHATLDSFRIVACHEIGHHLGGAPRRRGWFSTISWASNEGQSDYYANFICMKKLILEGQAQGLKVAAPDLSIYEEEEFAIADAACSQRFVEEALGPEGTDNNYTVCLRTILAGLSLGHILSRGNAELSLGTPDKKEVDNTNHTHPQAQCRVDTYMSSSLCDQNIQVILDSADPNIATCNRSSGFEYGLRPLCWYKPVEEEKSNDGGGWLDDLWLQASR